MKINDYESTTTLTDNDNFVVQTTAGTRKVSASLVRNSGSVGTEITMAEYEALTEEEKLNGTYWITDAEATNPEALKDLDSRVEVLENDVNSMGNIVSHSVAKASGTTANVAGGNALLPYPTGFNADNSMVIGYKVEIASHTYVSNGFADRIQIVLQEGGVNIYTNHSSMISKPVSVWLYQ